MNLRPLYFNGKFYGGGLNGVHRVADRLVRECDRELAQLPEAMRPPAYLMTSVAADWVPELAAIKRRNFDRTTQLWEQFVLPFAARDGILINLANLAPVLHRNKITMFHDVQFLFNDCGYPTRQRLGYRWLTPLMGRSSSATLTVSEYSRRMLDQYEIAKASRTHVIPNGADHILDAREDGSVRETLGLERNRYVLMFGSTKSYKNNAVVFAAFRSKRPPPVELVLIGPSRLQLEQAGLAVPQHALFAGHPDDGQLKALLTEATAIVFPSRTEGFGLPPLEAMLCGCPVVVSPAGAIPEACGDAVLYAGTDQADEWTEAIEALQTDQQLRAHKIAQGHRRARLYTWQRAGSRLMEVIHSVSQERLT